MFGQEHFDTRASGLRGFDEDESVFVGQYHSGLLERAYLAAPRRQLADVNSFRQAAIADDLF
jgi:hypothetical protein